jgi:hypothetical protein
MSGKLCGVDVTRIVAIVLLGEVTCLEEEPMRLGVRRPTLRRGRDLGRHLLRDVHRQSATASTVYSKQRWQWLQSAEVGRCVAINNCLSLID